MNQHATQPNQIQTKWQTATSWISRHIHPSISFLYINAKQPQPRFYGPGQVVA